MNALSKRIERWGARDFRIRYQGRSTAYWYYSGPFTSLAQAQLALSGEVKQ